MKPNKLGLLLLLASGWVGFYSTVRADELPDFVKTRSYIGVFATYADIDQWGGFDGSHGLYYDSGTTTEVDYVPAITREFGWGALVGHREGPWAMEISYMRSNHTATFSGLPSTPATYQSIDMTLKRYFLTKLPIQPFVNIGFSIPWIWVRQSSFLYDDTTSALVLSDDETISGIGLNLGAGLELYLDNGFSIMGGAFERWSSFDQINGASKIPLDNMYFDGNPTDVASLAGDGLNFYAGATLAVE